MLNMRGATLEQVGVMPQVGAQGTHLAVGPKGTAQQAHAVPVLNPLAIEHIGFTPGHILEMASDDQIDLEALSLQQFKDWDPVHLWIPSPPW